MGFNRCVNGKNDHQFGHHGVVPYGSGPGWCFPQPGAPQLGLLAGLVGIILAGIVLYGISAFFLKSTELKEVFTVFRKTRGE